MPGRGVLQRQPTQVVAPQGVQRLVQAGPCDAGRRAAQAFNQYLGGGKAFQHGRAHIVQPARLGQLRGFAHQAEVQARRHDLAYHHALGVGAQQFDEAFRGIVGKRQVLPANAGGLQAANALNHRRARADDQHRLRRGRLERGQQRCEVRLGTVELGHGHGLQAALLQPLARALQTVGAKAVVHVHHRHTRDAHGQQVRHGMPGLALVGGAHVEDVGFDRLVQHDGARGGAHHGHVVLLQHRVDGLGMRCAPAHEQGHHAALLDQHAGIGLGLAYVEGVVQRDDLDLLSGHAALGVDGIEVQLRAEHRFLDGGGDRAGHAHRLPDANLGRGSLGHQAQGHRQRQPPCVAPHG